MKKQVSAAVISRCIYLKLSKCLQLLCLYITYASVTVYKWRIFDSVRIIVDGVDK